MINKLAAIKKRGNSQSSLTCFSHGQRGTTLVEMLVVIAIISILSLGIVYLMTALFNSSIIVGQQFNQQSSSQTATSFFNDRLSNAGTGSVGMASGAAINPASIAGDQFTAVSGKGTNITCYRVFYLNTAKKVIVASQPVDSSTQVCKTGSQGIAPTRGPNQAGSTPADPVLDAMNLNTGQITGTLPSGSSAFTLIDNAQKLPGAGSLAPFTYKDSVGATSIDVDAQASNTSSKTWYTASANLSQVQQLEVLVNVNGNSTGAGATTSAKVFDNTYFIASDPASSGSSGSAASGVSSLAARVATTSALPAAALSGNVLTANSTGVIPQIDGQTLQAGDNVLVKNQASAVQNGLYQVNQLGTADVPGSPAVPGTNTDVALANLSTTDGLTSASTSKWTKTQWATATGTFGGSGWQPCGYVAGSSCGAYYNVNSISQNASNSGFATIITYPSASDIASRWVGVWAAMPSPGTAKSGYQLSWTDNTTTSTYTLELDKWVNGAKTVLASNPSVSFTASSQFALVVQPASNTVSAWINSGSGFVQKLSQTDSTYSSGYAGIDGSGSNPVNTNFKAAALTTTNGSPAVPGVPGTKWSMTRASGMDVDPITPGELVTVSEGTNNASSVYQLTTPAPITLNTTGLNFAIKSGKGSVSANELQPGAVGNSALQTDSVGTNNIQSGSVSAADLAFQTQPIQVCASQNSGQNSWSAQFIYLGTCGTSLPSGVSISNGAYCPQPNNGLCGGSYVQFDSSYTSGSTMLLVTMTYDMGFTGGGILVGNFYSVGGGSNQPRGSQAIGQLTGGQRETVTQTNIMPLSQLLPYTTGTYRVALDLEGSMSNNLVYAGHTKLTIVPLP